MTQVASRHRRNRPLFAIAARGIGVVGALILNLAIIRSLVDKSEAGSAILTYAFITVAAIVGRWGADNQLLVLSSADKTDSGDLLAAGRLVALLSILAGTGFALVLAARNPYAANVTTVVAVAFATVAAALSVCSAAILRGRGEVTVGALIELAGPTMTAAAAVALLGFAGLASVASVAVVLAVSYAACALTGWALVARVATDPARVTVGGFARRYWRSNTSFFLNTLSYYLLSWLPIFVLGTALRPAEVASRQVALYNAGSRLAQFVFLIEIIQISYLSNQFAAARHRADTPAIARIARRASLQALGWAVVIGTPMLIWPSVFLSVFGDYSAAAGTARVLIAGMMITVAIGPVNAMMLTCGYERSAERLSLAALAAVAVLLLIFVGRGSIATAFCLSVAMIAYSVACRLYLARKGLGF